jgi:hypothetical protein
MRKAGRTSSSSSAAAAPRMATPVLSLGKGLLTPQCTRPTCATTVALCICARASVASYASRYFLTLSSASPQRPATYASTAIRQARSAMSVVRSSRVSVPVPRCQRCLRLPFPLPSGPLPSVWMRERPISLHRQGACSEDASPPPGPGGSPPAPATTTRDRASGRKHACRARG